MSPRTVAALVTPLAAAAAIWLALRAWPGARAEGALADFIAQRAAAGDVVVVTPALSLDRLRAYHARGLRALSSASDAEAARAGFRRIWLVGPLGTGAAPMTMGGAAIERFELGRTVVLRVDRGPRGRSSQNTQSTQKLQDPQSAQKAQSPPTSRAEVLRWLDGARAYRRGPADAKERPCPREGERLRCGTEGWQHFGPERVLSGGAERECIWAHPIAGETLALELPSFAKAGAFTLVTRLADGALGRDDATPISVAVRALSADAKAPKGRVLATLQHPANAAESRARIDVPAGASALRLEVSAPRDGRAHFCLAREALR